MIPTVNSDPFSERVERYKPELENKSTEYIRGYVESINERPVCKWANRLYRTDEAAKEEAAIDILKDRENKLEQTTKQE